MDFSNGELNESFVHLPTGSLIEPTSSVSPQYTAGKLFYFSGLPALSFVFNIYKKHNSDTNDFTFASMFFFSPSSKAK